MKYICYLKSKTLPCYLFPIADTSLSERVLFENIFRVIVILSKFI